MSLRLFLLACFITLLFSPGQASLLVEGGRDIAIPIVDPNGGYVIGHCTISSIEKKEKRVGAFTFALSQYYEVSDGTLDFKTKPSFELLHSSLKKIKPFLESKEVRINGFGLKFEDTLKLKCRTLRLDQQATRAFITEATLRLPNNQTFHISRGIIHFSTEQQALQIYNQENQALIYSLPL